MQNYFSMSMSEGEVNAVSALGLAHVGDAVFELLVRSWICAHGDTTARKMHKDTVSYVSAPAQAAFVEKLLPLLTEEENALYRRGRNVHPHGVPKRASPGEYARATGLEALFGGLYLSGKTKRANELFVSVMEELYGV